MQNFNHNAYLLGYLQTEADNRISAIDTIREGMMSNILKSIEDFVYTKDDEEFTTWNTWLRDTLFENAAFDYHISWSILDAYQNDNGCFAISPVEDLDELLKALYSEYGIIFHPVEATEISGLNLNKDKPYTLSAEVPEDWIVYIVTRNYEIEVPD